MLESNHNFENKFEQTESGGNDLSKKTNYEFNNNPDPEIIKLHNKIRKVINKEGEKIPYPQKEWFIKKSISNFSNGKELPTLNEYNPDEIFDLPDKDTQMIQTFHEANEAHNSIIYGSNVQRPLDDGVYNTIKSDFLFPSFGNKIQQGMVAEMNNQEINLYNEIELISKLYDIDARALYETTQRLDSFSHLESDELSKFRKEVDTMKEDNKNYLSDHFGSYEPSLLYALRLHDQGINYSEEDFWNSFKHIEEDNAFTLSAKEYREKYANTFESIKSDPHRDFLLHEGDTREDFFVSPPSYMDKGDLIGNQMIMNKRRENVLQKIEEQLSEGKTNIYLEDHDPSSEKSTLVYDNPIISNSKFSGDKTKFTRKLWDMGNPSSKEHRQIDAPAGTPRDIPSDIPSDISSDIPSDISSDTSSDTSTPSQPEPGPQKEAYQSQQLPSNQSNGFKEAVNTPPPKDTTSTSTIPTPLPRA